VRFTVRRPANAEVFPRGHRPAGGDVACSVDVGVAPSSGADFALENRLALTVPRSDVPARGASLRRVRNLFDPTMSFVLQTRGQKAPTAAADSSVQPAFLSNTHAGLLDSSARSAGHRPHVKGFDPDRVEPACNISGDFFDPVLAPVGLPRFQLRDRQFRAGAPVRATVGPGEPLLQHRHRNATVDTDHAVIAWTGVGVRNVGEGHMPAAGPVTGDPLGLDGCGYRPRQAKPHPAHLGHPHPTKATVNALDEMRLDADLPKAFMHISFARRAAVRAAEEVAHGLCEIPQCQLLHGLTAGTKPRIFGARLGQLRALLDIPRGFATRLPVPLLLDGQIPHIPRVPTVRPQRLLLLRGRQQPKPRHNRTLTSATDNPDQARQPRSGDRLPPGLKAKVSSPREIR